MTSNSSNDELNPLYRAADDKYGTEYDTTQLRQGGHGRTVHRDYLAHCLRWGWAARQIRFGDKILDAGCGQDVSLYDVLAGTQSFQVNPESPESRARPVYVGVDLNPIKKRCGASWAYVEGGVNVVEDLEKRRALPHWGQFDVVTSFEVIEHMAVANGDRYLEALHEALAADGRLFLSTPVFNGRAAKNHIHEYTIPELQAKIESAGFAVQDRWGTFASLPDIRAAVKELQAMDPAGADRLLRTIESLRPYLGGEVLACFLAPLYPDHARNNVWVCTKR